jgi:exopolysaccharide biosynthesis polyprenyl glycosylphosphotransferase
MRRLFLQHHQKYRFLLLIGDLLIIIGSFSLILVLDAYEKNLPPWDIAKFNAIHLIMLAIIISVFYILDLYDLSKPKGSTIILLSICLGQGIVIILYSTLAYFIFILRFSKINMVLFIIMNIIFTFAWRMLYQKLIKVKPQRLLFIGKERIFEDIRHFIQSNHSYDYIIEGHWHSHSHDPTLPDLFKFIDDHNIDTIVYSVRSEIAKKITNDLIRIQFSNKHIVDAYNFYQHLTRKYPVYFLDGFWLLINAQREIFFPEIASNMKRAFDILFVLFLLPLAMPLLIMSALVIKLDSAGPVLFIQERLGQQGVPFRLIKLRTMVHHAENHGPRWCIENDSRITKVGKVLRKLRFDELPQLFNVLKGEMSLVGPRPIRQHFTEMLAKEIPFYNLRLLAKPGLTGWAQINYGHAHTNEGHSQMLQYDLFYLVHQSIWLDLLILFKTIKVMVWGKGT